MKKMTHEDWAFTSHHSLARLSFCFSVLSLYSVEVPMGPFRLFLLALPYDPLSLSVSLSLSLPRWQSRTAGPSSIPRYAQRIQLAVRAFRNTFVIYSLMPSAYSTCRLRAKGAGREPGWIVYAASLRACVLHPWYLKASLITLIFGARQKWRERGESEKGGRGRRG